MNNNIDNLKDIQQFQTPALICNYMASFLPDNAGLILEPTPGKGNLVEALKDKGEVIAPVDFFELNKNEYGWFDWIVMNPPFTPMKQGYDILYECMGLSDNIIALMPWLALINSTKRSKAYFEFGLKTITHLPRNIFKGSRVQTMIMELRKGYRGETRYIDYNFLKKYE